MAMVGNPASDRDADRGDARLPREDAGNARTEGAPEVEFFEHEHNGRVQPIDIVADGHAERLERERKIGRELPWQVKHAAATAIHPVDFDPERAKGFVIGPDVSAAASTAHSAMVAE